MPTHGAPKKFLGIAEQIPTNLDQTIILHASFRIALYDDALFSTFQTTFPDFLDTAVDKRKSEYLAGRVLAAQAISRLGIPPQDIPRGQNREPLWPKNLHGSITHSRERCACILTNMPNRYVGIDIEGLLSDNALRSVRRIAMTENDTAVFTSQSALSPQHFATLLFSAKEALYKALFPIVQSYFGFDSATLNALPSDDQIQLRLTRTLHPSLKEGQIFTLKHQQLDDKILTWIVHEKS